MKWPLVGDSIGGQLWVTVGGMRRRAVRGGGLGFRVGKWEDVESEGRG